VLGLFIAWPWLALVPAIGFALLWLRAKGALPLAAALAWLAYFPYELAMKLRILCSGECNIRIDLLLFYPLLGLLSIAALVYVLRRGQR
jgi:hypothetical protein